LKVALEQLQGAPCYHMLEVIGKPEHIPEWQRAIDGDEPHWSVIFEGYEAAVDWPTAAFYAELMTAYPDALVLLSTRADAAAWWKSASDTIFAAIMSDGVPPEFQTMTHSMLERRFAQNWTDAGTSMAAYDKHNADVRSRVPAERLVEWQPGDGWGPLCQALGVEVPDAPFPHVNTTSEFRAMVGLD
jgi:hypothetical protein